MISDCELQDWLQTLLLPVNEDIIRFIKGFIFIYLSHSGVYQRSDLWKGKSKEWSLWIHLTWPQPYLAGVGKVNSFSSLEDLFLFFKAWAAAAATGIWYLEDRFYAFKEINWIEKGLFGGFGKDNTDTDNATQSKVFEF